MIPFRTQRMATSVVNRILNVYADLPPKSPIRAEPAAPEPIQQGQALDTKLMQTNPPVDADPQTAKEIALSAGGLTL